MKDNKAKSRYELEVDGHTAFADYNLENNVLYIKYVEAPPALRGTGAAGKLMQDVMENAKAEGYQVVPICSYAASWIRRHEEFATLLV